MLILTNQRAESELQTNGKACLRGSFALLFLIFLLTILSNIDVFENKLIRMLIKQLNFLFYSFSNECSRRIN